MKELITPNEWQHMDESLQTLFPWYVKSFLDVLKTWDLSEKSVFEYGMGASTIWWGLKSKWVVAVDSDTTWFRAVVERSMALKIQNMTLQLMPVLPPEEITEYNSAFAIQSSRAYVNAIHVPDVKFDIIIIDGVLRDQCIKEAVKKMKPGATLIVDNWEQPSVWMPNQETLDLLATYEKMVFKQDGHPDWQTAYFTKK